MRTSCHGGNESASAQHYAIIVETFKRRAERDWLRPR
jgi:hypothetical protein